MAGDKSHGLSNAQLLHAKNAEVILPPLEDYRYKFTRATVINLPMTAVG